VGGKRIALVSRREQLIHGGGKTHSAQIFALRNPKAKIKDKRKRKVIMSEGEEWGNKTERPKGSAQIEGESLIPLTCLESAKGSTCFRQACLTSSPDYSVS